MKVNSTISLKLYAYGINKLHDPNWTGMELYDKLKQHVRQRVEPIDMLFKTIKNGLLFHIGKWMYEEYFEHSQYGEEEFIELFPINGEYLLWYIEDYLELLIDAGVDENDSTIKKVYIVLQNYDKEFDKDEENYFKQLEANNDKNKSFIYKLSVKFQEQITNAKVPYAEIFAERVFHDRMLCEFISKLIITIGFDGSTDENDYPQKWIKREYLPTWAEKAIISRDRGLCADCGESVVAELTKPYHFDHIVPLHQGGTNDLSNFQLLCDKCNLTKSSKIIPVKSSIPSYLQNKKKPNNGQ